MQLYDLLYDSTLLEQSLDPLHVRDTLRAAALNQLAGIDRIAVVAAHEVLPEKHGQVRNKTISCRLLHHCVAFYHIISS